MLTLTIWAENILATQHIVGPIGRSHQCPERSLWSRCRAAVWGCLRHQRRRFSRHLRCDLESRGSVRPDLPADSTTSSWLRGRPDERQRQLFSLPALPMTAAIDRTGPRDGFNLRSNRSLLSAMDLAKGKS